MATCESVWGARHQSGGFVGLFFGAHQPSVYDTLG
jgi:hypothetical protein